MECNTSEFHCLNLTSQDLSQLESISAAYFGTREIEEDAVEVNSASEDSSCDVEDNIHREVEGDEEVLEDGRTEGDKVQLFYTETCKCKLGSEEKACSTTLTQDEFIESRNNCYELSSTELDLVRIRNHSELLKLQRNQHFWQSGKSHLKLDVFCRVMDHLSTEKSNSLIQLGVMLSSCCSPTFLINTTKT